MIRHSVDNYVYHECYVFWATGGMRYYPVPSYRCREVPSICYGTVTHAHKNIEICYVVFKSADVGKKTQKFKCTLVLYIYCS